MSSQEKQSKRVKDYYDSVQWIYDVGWNIGKTHSVHYGLWFDGTKTLAQAIDNSNMLIANALNIQKGDVILDAGCGVGGTSFYLAKRYDCKVVGISVSPYQIKRAKELARKQGITNVEFKLMDYTETEFEDQTINKIFGLESLSYAIDKQKLYREFHRILKPSGIVAVLDAFLARPCKDKVEARQYEQFRRGWGLPEILSLEEFIEIVTSTGLVHDTYDDYSHTVFKTSQSIWRRHLLVYPLITTLYLLGLVNRKVYHHVFTGIVQVHVTGKRRDNVLRYVLAKFIKP